MKRDAREQRQPSTPPTCRSVDWYSEGEGRVVDIGSVQLLVGFVGRKGRRVRIAITGPSGTTFQALEKHG